MKTVAGALVLALPMLFHSAFAATEQQNKMATCNKEAGDKKGDERKAFMKECLSAKSAANADSKTASSDPKAKMKSCNAQAQGKKGDERKAFMKECLSGTTNATMAPQSRSDKSKPALESPKP